MVSHYKIYVEGSGDNNKLQSVGRSAMKNFLSKLELNGSIQIIMCGGRQQAYNDFCVAMKNMKPDGDMPLLLVDSESLVDKHAEPWTHLQARDNWSKPDRATDTHAYLMAQTMEAWIVCDPSAWKAWKPRIDSDKLPAIHNNNVELLEKDKLENICELICKTIDLSYLKSKRLNGFGILKYVQPELVRKNSKEANRFFEFIEVRKGNLP